MNWSDQHEVGEMFGSLMSSVVKCKKMIEHFLTHTRYVSYFETLSQSSRLGYLLRII